METMNEKDKQNHEYAEEGFWTGHYHYLLQALAIATNRCQVWRLVETGDAYTLNVIFEFAKAWDAEHELKKGQFYMVTIEGAIGISPGLEYLTKWMFTPMEPGKERDFLLQELQEKLDRMAAEEQAERAPSDSPQGGERGNLPPSTLDFDEEATVAAPPPLPKVP